MPDLDRSVDVELVALRVLHRDPVMVEALGVEHPDDGGAEPGQAARLGVDPLLARGHRHVAAAAGADVEVQPVLDGLGLSYTLRSSNQLRRVTMTRHTAVYTRISKDRNGRAEGVAAQEKWGRDYAAGAWPDVPV